MPRDSIKDEIVEIFKKSELKWKEQTVRDNVSRFKIKYCSSCTQNAAAYILGLVHNVKIWQKLEKVDKNSIPGNVQEIIERYNSRTNRPSYIQNSKKEVVVKKIGKTNPYDFSLSLFNLHQGLTEDCTPIFKKPFRSAIKEALLNLEDHIRNKISSDKDGKELISEAKLKGVFNRKRGSETEGLFFLYAGAIGWLRNPPNHQKLKYNREDALKIILFTDYLIKLFDQLCLENTIK